jgi:hypothetical protein
VVCGKRKKRQNKHKDYLDFLTQIHDDDVSFAAFLNLFQGVVYCVTIKDFSGLHSKQGQLLLLLLLQ